jgi:MoxR-like ATPase
MPSALKIGSAEITMRSDPTGTCLHFGKARCIHPKMKESEKSKKKENRCSGNNSECQSFIGQSAFVPRYDDKYLLPAKESEVLSLALQNGDNILLSGVPGSGKTSLVKQLAAILNWGVIQFSCSEETSSSKLIGQWIVANKSMAWHDGYITTAMKKGYILLEDEGDFMRPELRGELHSIMEDEGTVILSAIHPETKQPFQELIKKHPNFRWVSTANTIGLGDDDFQYHGTQYFNSAARDRYSIILQFKYKDSTEEEEILVAKTEIDRNIAKLMIKIANECRAQQNKEVLFQFTLRRLLSWATYWKRIDPKIATELSVLNFCSDTDRYFINGLVRTHLGIEIQ